MSQDCIEHILEVIFQLAAGKLEARCNISDESDQTDALMAGINMLAEELQATMVSKDLLEKARDQAERRTREVESAHLELKMMQGQMMASSKMSALGEMASGIAHEINNPLTVIKARAEHLLSAANENRITPEQIQKSTQTIINTSHRIAKIVKSMRTFSRDAEQDPFQPTSLKSIVDETLELCHERFRSHDIQFWMTEIPAELTLECRGIQIGQVLLNLLNNAHDAVEGLKGSWIHLGVEESLDSIQITITDSGFGIPIELHEKIIQPFFTTKETGKGTGLGLSVSLGIVTSHSGRLSIDRHWPNTRFVVWLPKRQAAPATSEKQGAA